MEMNNQTSEKPDLQFEISEYQEQIKQLFDRNGLAAIEINTEEDTEQIAIEYDSMELGGQMPTNITLIMNRIVDEIGRMSGISLYWWFSIETPWKVRVAIK